MDLFGRSTQAVVMTNEHATALVNAVVEAVTAKAMDGRLENYQQLARLEIDLAKARSDMERMQLDSAALTERKDAEIAALREHITRLTSMVVSLAPNAANFQTATIPVPVFTTSPPVPFLDPMTSAFPRPGE